MTRRERTEAQVAKREEWAASRRQKADALRATTDRYRGDWAFATQPGHIPERARVIRAQDRAFEHADMAAHHDAKATGLEAQLDRTIFSDDDNAITALEARIAQHEAERERMKLVNKLYKKGDAAGLAALGLDLERLQAQVAHVGLSFVRAPFEGFKLTNLGARIRTDRERIEEIKRCQGRTERAEAAGGVVVEGGEYVRVTFAEKPEREILDALRAAGFQWSSGSWVGARAKLPAAVAP